MEKMHADLIINKYLNSIFGFSLNKTRKTEEAEELSNKIVLKVYETLLVKDNILNIQNYIFKIAHNVWVNYVNEKVRGSNIIEINSVNEILFCDGSIEHSIIEDEDRELLRREIAYLSRMQRQIVILHYFQDMKINQIAEKLNIPTGTVKWHLYESKKDIKKGMVKVRKVGNLGLNPIKFSNMGHSGSPGKLGDTNYFLGRSITQNIAYAAYRKAMSIAEIADELGVSPIFVEDEVSVLEEYGFMEKVSNDRFVTNIYINEFNNESVTKKHKLFEKYAKIIGECYCKELFNLKEKLEATGIYYPDEDFNYMLWTVIPYAIKKKLFLTESQKIKSEELYIARKDGGNYIAFAAIHNVDKLPFEGKYYGVCGDMTRIDKKFNCHAWQFNTYWCRRKGWQSFTAYEAELCYKYKNGLLPYSEDNVDEYKFLIDKGYLLKEESGYKLNVLWYENKEVLDKFNLALPAPSKECLSLIKNFDKEYYEIECENKPPHINKLVKYYCQNTAASAQFTAYVLKYLVDIGLLKEPEEHQKKTITTIMGCLKE